MLRIGDPVPEVMVEAYVRGEPGPRRLSLGDYRDRWLALFFYPRDFTFVCPTELTTFADLHGAFHGEGAEVLAASTDSYYSHRAWFESDPRLAAVGYPVIADTTHELARAFGVLLADGAAARGTFLIDPDGTVRHLTVTDISVGRSVRETLRTLQAIRTGELCPAEWQPGQPTLQPAIREHREEVAV